MPGTRYRLGKPTRAIYAEDGAKGFVLLPEGAVLTMDGFESPERLVRIRWNDLLLLMFWQDLLERGLQIEEPRVATVRVATQRV